MRSCSFALILFVLVFFTLAQAGFPLKYKGPDKGLVYRQQNRSLIQWEKINHKKWADFGVWLKKRKLRDKSPNWRVELRDRLLRENVGRVLQCAGKCFAYRDETFIRPEFNSIVKEGDNIVTGKNSYAWVFLFDGTMVRLAPHTSVSFKELNVGTDEIFLHARINSGSVFWLSRDMSPFKEREKRETDALFIPLDFQEANSIPEEERSNDLFEVLDSGFVQGLVARYRRLNKLISENNKTIVGKPTYSFIVMPNGTIFGRNLRTDIFVSPNNNSYFKNRSFNQYGGQENVEKDATGLEESPVSFFYRGFDSTGHLKILTDKWYQVDSFGRNVNVMDNREATEFLLGELITRRIPRILVARELLIQKYSMPLFKKDISKFELAGKAGLRLWGKLFSSDELKKEDMQMRFEFLKEYTRRVETSFLITSAKLKAIRQERGDIIENFEFGAWVYERAFSVYSSLKEKHGNRLSDRNILNSTQSKAWIRFNGK